MNNLEKMALTELRNVVQEMADNCHEKRAESFQHQRIHLRGAALKALEIIKAIEDNNSGS